MRVRILNQGILHKDLPNLVGMDFEFIRYSPIGSAYISLPDNIYFDRSGVMINRQFVEVGDFKEVDESVVAVCGSPVLTAASLSSPTPGYADGNPKSLQGAKKFSLRYLPLSANIAVNQAFEDGAAKYGAANWREKGVAATVYVDAALRHIMQYFDGGQRLAADSGVHNLGHAMACLAIIIDAEQEGQLIDDRPFSAKDTDALLKRPVK